MFGFLKKMFGFLAPKKEEAEIDADEIVEEEWQADFGGDFRFETADEKSHRAHITEQGETKALALDIAKPGTIAWTENPRYRYRDLALRARIRIESAGYAAAGFLFRMVDDGTCYMALVSNRGYFRLDALRNAMPLALAGWTEIPNNTKGGADKMCATKWERDFTQNHRGVPPIEGNEYNKDKGGADFPAENGIPESSPSRAPAREPRDAGLPLPLNDASVFDFGIEIVAYGSHIVLLINGAWAAEFSDPSLSEGRIAFCAALYGDASAEAGTARALLLSFSLDSRTAETGERYDAVSGGGAPESCLALAETFTALGQTNAALVQLRRCWELRKEAGILPRRLSRELLLGAKLALALEQNADAEEYIEEGLLLNASLRSSEETVVEKSHIEDAAAFRSLKASLLYAQKRYEELLSWAALDEAGGASKPGAAGGLFFNLLGNAAFNLSRYREAADYYERAFALDSKNGAAAKNAAASYELLGEKEAALSRYLDAGRAFLAEGLYGDLGVVASKLKLLGGENWEARALVGKWAFGIEHWVEADEELNAAEELRLKKNSPQGCRGRGDEAPVCGEVSAESAPPLLHEIVADPPDPAVYYLQALLLVKKNKRRDALALFEKAARLAPDYPLFRFRYAEHYFLLNGEVPAEDLEAALCVKPEDGETYGWVHNFAAQAALAKGDVSSAAAHLEKAAEVLGEVPAVRVNRAVSFSLAGSLEKALAVLESKQSEDPEGLMANCAGNLLVRAGRCEEADAYYQKALAAAPRNAQYRYNRAQCLVELGRYGEADDVLTGADDESPPPEVLELIAFVAAKKGEYRRAEAATKAALEIDPDRAPSLLHLGWSRAAQGKWDEVAEILDRLDELDEVAEDEELSRRRDELDERWLEATTRLVECGACGREWRVNRVPEKIASLRLYAMPPDDMPAGTCPSCGASFCVGCRKESLDEAGRFTCPDCGKPLKLTDDGLREMVYEWAQENVNPKMSADSEPQTGAEEEAINTGLSMQEDTKALKK